MDALNRYFSAVRQQLTEICKLQQDKLDQAATLVAESLKNDRFIYTFGSGHSHALAEETFYRAGGLARAVAILDEKLMVHESAVESTMWERKEGFAANVIARYPITNGDLLFVVSNSGRNAVPIEMAMEARKVGAQVVAITSVAYSGSIQSRHSSGKKLVDVVDLVIDNRSVAGDAVVSIDGLPQKAGPTSTITSAFILNSILVAAMEKVVSAGKVVEVWGSANSDNTNNEAMLAKYRGRIPHL